jgi:hypothetical protein
MTDLGPLDALGAIEGGADYPQLLPECLAVPIGGLTVHVLSLAKLVAPPSHTYSTETSPRARALKSRARRRAMCSTSTTPQDCS